LQNAVDIYQELLLLFDSVRSALRRQKFSVVGAVKRACDHMEQLNGTACIRQVASHVGVSTRTLERWFDEHVGLGPKTYARVRRQWAASRRTLAPGRINWSDIALSLGYCDQSHFVREFTNTYGFSPARFRDLVARRGLSFGPYVFMPVDLTTKAQVT
jgi:AraC-like DNA-binding protein